MPTLLAIYKEILAATAPIEDLNHIDFDRGQLDNPPSYEALIQPALLVGIPTVEWGQLPQNNQMGEVQFYTKLVIRLPHETAIYPRRNQPVEWLTEQNEAAMWLENDVHQAIMALDTVYRTRTQYEWVDTFFVVTHYYQAAQTYDSSLTYTRFRPSGSGIQVIIDEKVSRHNP